LTDKCFNLCGFLGHIFDDEKLAKQVSKIMEALLESPSPRLSHISEKMAGNGESN